MTTTQRAYMQKDMGQQEIPALMLDQAQRRHNNTEIELSEIIAIHNNQLTGEEDDDVWISLFFIDRIRIRLRAKYVFLQ